MRIFLFSTTFHPRIGGIEELNRLLCLEFAKLGHDVRVATLVAGEEDDLGLQVQRFPSNRDLLQLVRWCDIHMQANCSLKYAWLLSAARGHGVIQHNSSYESKSAPFQEGLKRYVSRLFPGIAVSRYVQRRVRCAHVIHNAFDPTQFKGPEVERDGVVFVGRLTSEKGCHVLIKALGILAGRGRRVRASIVGDGADRENLEALVREEGLVNDVEFIGPLFGDARGRVVRAHEVLVVPSVCPETFGIVALEGLAAGCAVIASDAGGLPEALGSFGLFFKQGDCVQLAGLLERALAEKKAEYVGSDPKIQAHLATFQPRTVAQKYIKVFNQIKCV